MNNNDERHGHNDHEVYDDADNDFNTELDNVRMEDGATILMIRDAFITRKRATHLAKLLINGPPGKEYKRDDNPCVQLPVVATESMYAMLHMMMIALVREWKRFTHRSTDGASASGFRGNIRSFLSSRTERRLSVSIYINYKGDHDGTSRDRLAGLKRYAALFAHLPLVIQIGNIHDKALLVDEAQMLQYVNDPANKASKYALPSTWEGDIEPARLRDKGVMRLDNVTILREYERFCAIAMHVVIATFGLRATERNHLIADRQHTLVIVGSPDEDDTLYDGKQVIIRDMTTALVTMRSWKSIQIGYVDLNFLGLFNGKYKLNEVVIKRVLRDPTEDYEAEVDIVERGSLQTFFAGPSRWVLIYVPPPGQPTITVPSILTQNGFLGALFKSQIQEFYLYEKSEPVAHEPYEGSTVERDSATKRIVHDVLASSRQAQLEREYSKRPISLHIYAPRLVRPGIKEADDGNVPLSDMETTQLFQSSGWNMKHPSLIRGLDHILIDHPKSDYGGNYRARWMALSSSHRDVPIEAPD